MNCKEQGDIQPIHPAQSVNPIGFVMNKTFEIDFDSIDDCTRLRNIMKSRIGELRSRDPGFVSKNDSVKNKFNACQKILDADISSLYADMDLSEEKIFYVYAHCDPNYKIAIKKDGISTFSATLDMTHLPFYIGKGSGDRANCLDRNGAHRKHRQRLRRFGKDIYVSVIKNGLTEMDAFILESKLIDIFGLTSFGGRLVNLDEGVKNKERRDIYQDELKVLSLFYSEALNP